MSSHSLPTTLCRCPQAVHCCHEDRLCLADLKPGNLLVKPGAPGPAVYLCDVEAVMALPKVCAGSTLPHCSPLTAVPRCGTLTPAQLTTGVEGRFCTMQNPVRNASLQPPHCQGTDVHPPQVWRGTVCAVFPVYVPLSSRCPASNPSLVGLCCFVYMPCVYVSAHA